MVGMVVIGALTSLLYFLVLLGGLPSFNGVTSFLEGLQMMMLERMMQGGGGQSFGLIFSFFSLYIYMVFLGFVIQITCDAKKGVTKSLTTYLPNAFKRGFFAALITIPVIIAIMLAVLPGVFLGAGLELPIPGALLVLAGILFVSTIYAVFAPAIFMENIAWSALGRSRILTKGYRLPVAGAIVLVWLIMFVMLFAIFGALTGLFVATGESIIVIVLAVIVYLLTYSLVYGMGGVYIALLYARLLEIKEGVSAEDIGAVFD